MRMRKPGTGIAAQTSSPPRSPADVPTQLVCVALLLALVTLAARIASIW
jgi:hypothetical protein